jgi:hypothetical protein
MLPTTTNPRLPVASLVALICALPLAATSYDLLPVKDARILGLPGYEDANYRYDLLSVYTYGENVQRTLLEFDLAPVVLAPGERLASATLRLHGSLGFGGSQGVPMEVYAVARPWTEDGLTWRRASAAAPWSRPGGDFVGVGGVENAPAFAVSTASPANAAPVTWELRELVDQWLEGMAPNHGLLLKSSEGNGLTFTQRESASGGLRPGLSIVTEPGPPRLRIERESGTGNVLLSWRGVGIATLQERVAIGTELGWVDSALTVVPADGRSVVTVPQATAARFYRLRSN